MNWAKSLLGGKSRKPQVPATATLQKEAGNLYVLRVGGLFDKAAMDRIHEISAADFAGGLKSLNVLIVLNDFQGWKRGDDWGNIDFFIQFQQNIARIAVVGEARWEAEMLMFLAAGHRKGEVRYFGPEEEATARAWLAS